MRLIDADALIDKLPKEYLGSTIHLLINDAPTVSADAVSFEDAMQIQNTILFKEYMRGRKDAVQGWIPCSERLPKELEAVNVTWVNHNPPVYYQHIKDVPKADTAVYYSDAWYWWDATVIDLLGEYGGAYIHGIEPIDKDVEVTAWMPLPKPYREESEVEE